VALAWALLARLWQTALELAFVAAATLADRRRARDPRRADATGPGDDGVAGAPRRHGDDR
jgi:hypothetical protein